jgi:hypothetical protein
VLGLHIVRGETRHQAQACRSQLSDTTHPAPLREFAAYFRKPPDRLGVEEVVGAIPECLSHPNFY